MLRKNKKPTVRQVIFYATYLLGVLATILSACASQTVIPTLLPISTSTQPRPSETSTLNSTATLEPTLRSTATPKVDAITALAREFKIPKSCLTAYIISNDQNWIAGDCPLYRKLIIANKLSSGQITISYNEFEDGSSDYFSTTPLSWANDNRYLYFTTRCCNAQDDKNSNGSLYQFDAKKESWSILIHTVYEPFYFFSPGGDRYVFFNHYLADNFSFDFAEYLEVGIVDVHSNKNKRIVLRYYWGQWEGLKFEGGGDGKTNYKWSKAADKFAIVLLKVTPHSDSASFETALLTIDFNKMDMELFEKFDENNLLGEE